MKHFFTAFLLFAALPAAVFAQSPAPSPTPPKADEDEVVIVSTNLIQVDAIVTGKDGKQVTDLKPEDFEVLVNGEKQKITNFSYVTASPEVVAVPATAGNKSEPNAVDKLAPPVPVRLKPEQVRRTIALVVDDLGLSFESTAFVRQALKKFVDEQMQPNDLVAIVRTGGGIGALQQFTSDKRQLYAAIEKVRFNPIGRSGVGAFSPIEPSLSEIVANQTQSPTDADNAKVAKQSAKNADNFRTDIFSVGTLGALNYIVKGMGELPGRKAVVLMSDGFSIFNRDADGNIDPNAGQRVLDALRRLTDLANRASVVVNTIDARGLQTLTLTAQDDTGGLTSEQIEQRLSDRKTELFDTQEGLNYLAQQTGGRAFRNNNDIKGSVEKVLDDQRGYYLLGYQPDEAIFDPKQKRFNKLTIKLNRPGLKVRYRSGFFGVVDEEARSAKQTPQQQIFSALTSPFGANGVNVRLNTIFGNDAKNGSYIRSLLHVNAKDLKFTDEPDGLKKAVFDVVAFIFGDNGAPIDSVNKTYTLRIDKEQLPRLLEKGFIYYVTVPIKKPGAYQLRVALMDERSEKIGAANQFVEVPNLKKERLTLSGLVLQAMTFDQYQKIAEGQQTTAEKLQNNGDLDSDTDTALRRFRRGSVLQYGYAIYNAKLAAGANRPQLTAQMRIFRDGKIIFDGKPSPLDFGGQTDLQHLNAGSALALPANMEPGDYVLQIIVTDNLAKEKSRIATQYVEFELTN